MKRHPRALARRYARALHTVAAAEGAAERLSRELGELSALLAGHPELSAALAHPSVSPEARSRVLRAVVERAGGSPLLARLVVSLAGHERLGMLDALAVAYGEELQAAQGVVAATAVSAVPLDSAQAAGLAQALAVAAGRKVELTKEVDPAVLGGILVRMGGRNYDGTVRAQLQALRRRLAAGS